MESQALRSAVRRLRQVATVPPAGPDAELLRAFVTHRDAAAFEQIVRRHGPMVLGACRRVLRDPADADDAFQATFLVLVRKGGSLRQPDRLAGWLYQVAHRVARKARALRLKRAQREAELFDVPAGERPAEIVWRELRPVFDAELDRLPDRLRLPAVLCLLEGRSKAEAARALGWPEGTLSCRLQRAREKLRLRFAARGLTLSAGALAAALFEGAGSAAVPDRLIASTIQSVTTAASTTAARALADGVTQAMFLAKVKAAAAAVLVAGVVGTGTGVALVPGGGPGLVAADEPAKGAATRGPVPREVAPSDPKGLASQIEVARVGRIALDTQPEAAQERSEVARRELQQLLQRRLDDLRSKAERLQPLVVKGTYPRAEWDQLQNDIKLAEAEVKAFAGDPSADPDRVIRGQDLELLKDRLAFEERMVQKGFMTEAQVKKTRVEVARAEAALAKADAPKAPDPRRAILEDTVHTLETLLERTEAAFKQGAAGEAEVLHTRVRLNEAKLKLLELGDRPAATPVTAHAELGATMADKEKELERAEALRKRNAISEDDVRRLRIDLGRLRAAAAAARGDFAEEAKQREAVVAEFEARAALVRRSAERVDLTQADLRAVNVAVAEARVEALKANVRRQLAEIVQAKEEGLRDIRRLFDARAVPASEVGAAERALADAKARLAAER